MNKIKKVIALIMVVVLSMNITVLAAGTDDISTEVNSFEEVESWEGEIDQYVDGKYNTSSNARAAITGALRLAQSGTKVVCSYSTSYSTSVSRIGVRNVRLMYLTSLKVWNTIVTLDDRYCTNDSLYAGSFTVTGTYNRTYMASCTHYYTNTVSSVSKYNETGELTFK